MKNTKRYCKLIIALFTFLVIVSSTGTLEVSASQTTQQEIAAERVDLDEFLDDETVGRTVRATSSDYREWAQGDSRWGSISLGGTVYTMKRSGCLVTSVTKLIVQSGLKDASAFTPKTLVTWLNANNGFTNTGGLYWGKPAEYVSGFQYVGDIITKGTYTSSNYNKKFISWINQGYHMVVQVDDGGHWVAVDEEKTLENGTVYIMDSQPTAANADITLASRYSTFNRVVAYKGGETPEVLPETPTLKVESNSDSEKDVSVRLIWTKARDYTEGYLIERSDNKEGPWEQLKKIADGNDLDWVDEDVEPETTYCYRVQPYNEAEEGGPYTNIVSFKTKHIHSYERTVAKKATTKENGKLKDTCISCGYEKYVTISRIDQVTLSTTAYYYTGKVRKPAVTVKNKIGNEINESYYTVT